MRKIFVFAFLLPQLVFGQTAEVSKDDMNLTIREIMEKYYEGKNFYVGSTSEIQMWKLDNKFDEKYAKFFFNEVSYNTPENCFKQQVVNRTDGGKYDIWNSSEYQYFIKQARKHKQVLRAHCPISPQCNEWARDDIRSSEELMTALTNFMTRMSTELEKNKDVVLWMDVVNEVFSGSRQKGIGYEGKHKDNDVIYEFYDWFGPKKGCDKWENPWTQIGFETVTYNGETFEIPKYIRMAFEIANKYAPNVKKVWNSHGRELKIESMENLQRAVSYIRSLGLDIDAIAWQAHLNLGWEKKQENIDNLQKMISWCYENGLEFHISELDIIVAEGEQEKCLNQQALERTREQQAATLGALFEVFLQNRGKGAVGFNCWTLIDHFNGGTTFASIFDQKLNPTPAYFRMKELLLKYRDL